MKDLFLQNVVDQIKEAQIKLGYEKESIRLYYPIQEMEDITGASFVLEEFIKQYKTADNEGIGPIDIHVLNHRLEICINAEGVEYIHNCISTPRFLIDIVELFKIHHISLEDIHTLFGRYSKDYVCIQMMDTEDFDYMFRFKDSSIDSYYYCIKFEMGHTIYHRFTKAAYLRNGWKE